MLVRVHGACKNCQSEVSVILLDGQILENCHECGEPPFASKQVAGMIYIAHNPHIGGVKIGLTTKHIEERLKALSSTGVPGRFDVIAIFPSDKPKEDERKVHEKLKRKRLDKEHFQVEPLEAALAAYRALNRREPIFYDSDLQDAFYLRLESDKITMQLKLKGHSV